MLKVRDDRVADFLSQWQLMSTTSLSSYIQATGLPVDVAQLERNDLPRTQSQSGQKEEDRVVASPDCSTAIDVRQHLSHLVWGYCPRDERHRPTRHDRHRREQIRADLPAVAPVTQEGSQSRGQQLCSLYMKTRCLSSDESDNIPGTQL